MAKLYGQLVGAPVNALKTGLIGIAPPHCKDSFDLVLARDYVTLAGNVIGDQISLGSFKSNTFVDALQSQIMTDGLGAGTTGNIGDATYPSGLVAGLSLATAGLWQAIMTQPPLAAQIAAPLWQRLGYAADPGRRIELLLTFAGANPGNVGIAWYLLGREM